MLYLFQLKTNKEFHHGDTKDTETFFNKTMRNIHPNIDVIRMLSLCSPSLSGDVSFHFEWLKLSED